VLLSRSSKSALTIVGAGTELAGSFGFRPVSAGFLDRLTLSGGQSENLGNFAE
jgi:hypothetical protein